MNTVAIFQSYVICIHSKSLKVLCRICNFPWEKCIKWNHDNFPELELLCKSNKDLIREINIQLQQNVLSFDAFQRAKKQAKKPSIIFTERENEFQIHSLPLLGKNFVAIDTKVIESTLKNLLDMHRSWQSGFHLRNYHEISRERPTSCRVQGLDGGKQTLCGQNDLNITLLLLVWEEKLCNPFPTF